ncbi:mCG144736, partial [Mus musculus]
GRSRKGDGYQARKGVEATPERTTSRKPSVQICEPMDGRHFSLKSPQGPIILGLLHGCWGSNSDLHAYSARMLLPEMSPQPFLRMLLPEMSPQPFLRMLLPEMSPQPFLSIF